MASPEVDHSQDLAFVEAGTPSKGAERHQPNVQEVRNCWSDSHRSGEEVGAASGAAES